MYTPFADATDYAYGYGWVIQNSEYGTLVGHSGGIFGFCSIFLNYVEADLAVIVLGNVFQPVDGTARDIAAIACTS